MSSAVPSTIGARTPRTSSLALLASLTLAAAASAQYTVSDPEAIFVPCDEVPLSEFVAAHSGVQVTLHVRPQILRWLSIQSHPIEVAVSIGGTVTDVAPDSYDALAGTVLYTPSADAFVTVVSDALLNDLPIVTHWDPTANALDGYDPDGAGPLLPDPRGGFVRDATGGIGTLDFVEVPVSSGNWVLESTGNALNHDGAVHSDAYGTYRFATHRYAIFSDGSETTPDKDGEIADADVPSYEHYTGENWAAVAVTDLAAIRLSDLSRQWTSLPVAHRNPTPAFDAMAPATQQLQAGLPVFQIVHAYVVGYDDPLITGREDSLATFIVPPLWTPEPARDYAVLFNAFYDIHASTFGAVGNAFLHTLGELLAAEKTAVGIMSNGGGAGTCLTQQASIYPNITKLFDEATTLLAIDRTKVVTTGGSRGGTSSLSLAASPGYAPFTAQYVVAGNPSTFPGDVLMHHVNPTYGLVQASMPGFSGYQESWIPGWTGPGGKTGPELVSQTIFGTDVLSSLDTSYGTMSSPFTGALLSKGSKVVLQIGTHDYSRSMAHSTGAYEALLAAGVPVRMEVGYRFGHGSTQGTQPDVAELLSRVITGVHPTFETGTYYFHPTSVAAEGNLLGTEFVPAHAPMVLEAPPVTALGQEATYTVSGPPGTSYSVWVAPIDYDDWVDVLLLTFTGTASLAFSGTLPTAATGVEIVSNTHQLTVPADLAYLGPWSWGIGYTVPGFSYQLTAGEDPAPPSASHPNGTYIWDMYDVAPISFFGDILEYDMGNTSLPVQSMPFNTVNWAAFTRTSGLSTDIDFSP